LLYCNCLIAPHFFNENLQLLLAKTYIAMDLQAKDKPLLDELVSKNLLKEEAQKLLIKMI